MGKVQEFKKCKKFKKFKKFKKSKEQARRANRSDGMAATLSNHLRSEVLDLAEPSSLAVSVAH